MGSKIVFRSLTELFPQIDARILKAVAIEHPKDADVAAAVVISEIVPKFYPDLSDDHHSSQPENKKTPVKEVPDNNEVERDVPNGALTGSFETGASSSSSSSGTISIALDGEHGTKAAPVTTELLPTGDLGIQSKAVIGSDESRVVSSAPPASTQAGIKPTSDVWEGIDFPFTGNQAAESSTSAASKQKSSKGSDDGREASLSGENSDAELSGSVLVEETSKGSLSGEDGDSELAGAFTSTVSRSTQGSKIDHLEQIIEDAKSNKRTLFIVMESIMNLMREVELQEKDAEKVKEDATRGGFDTLKKVEDLKKILAHAKEGNDMDAGEVYGERSVLATEVNELENRLLSLSEERDKSLSVLDEMRGVLETRLAAALEIKNAAEQEIQEKEGDARKELAEQEAIMDKVVQESKLLQKEAEENSKLREFLMDRGRVVDSLQGEIYVICKDIRLLKEKFDNGVPLSQSITSSQTSCKLASSVSSMKSLVLEKPLEQSYEAPEASGNSKSPEAWVTEGKEDVRNELLEDGWDIFEKEIEF
ncbi:ELKS/Rab6-interacting/CAST family protein [Hirschfeldia incana]|nr:ELKS/Rab6-interacting/CAST family protein [Hirschfeldia incana]KAJ0250161.1 ELKS/Rab6-interacting/CAST family protein [Hirschfeldia incana]